MGLWVSCAPHYFFGSASDKQRENKVCDQLLKIAEIWQLNSQVLSLAEPKPEVKQECIFKCSSDWNKYKSTGMIMLGQANVDKSNSLQCHKCSICFSLREFSS